MKKVWYVPFLLLLIVSLVGCNTDNATETSDNVNETTEIIEEDLEEVQEKSLRDTNDENANTELENETEGANTGQNSEQHPPVSNDVGGQGITDEGQNTDANTVAD